MGRKFKGRPDGRQAKDVLRETLDVSGDPGYLEFIGKGATYSALTVETELDDEPTDVVVRVPRHHAADLQVVPWTVNAPL